MQWIIDDLEAQLTFLSYKIVNGPQSGKTIEGTKAKIIDLQKAIKKLKG